MGLFDLIARVRLQRAHDASVKDAVRLVQRCARVRVTYTKPESTATRDEQFVTDLVVIQATLEHLLSGPRGDCLHREIHDSVVALLIGAMEELDRLIMHEPLTQDKEHTDATLYMIDNLAKIVRDVLHSTPGSEDYKAQN